MYCARATTLLFAFKYCWVMCSRQRMKRDNAHTLYLGYVRTSGENALKKTKTKHFDTARRDRARLLTPTSLTVHRFAFVAFHSSVTARKSNTQDVTAYGLNKTERREDSAPLANHTRTRLALVLISLHCGAHIKSVGTIFLQATAKAYSQMEMCIHKKKKKDCRAHEHNSSAVGQLLWWEKLRMQKEEKPCLLQWCCKRSVHSFMPYTHKYL